MKLGITGLPGAGRTTLFEALTGSGEGEGRMGENRIGSIRVPDERVDVLSDMYHPKKTIWAQVEYFLPGALNRGKDGRGDPNAWTPLRDCDALIHVVRNFQEYGMEPPVPFDDFRKLNQDMILTDLISIENRLERMEKDKKRGKGGNPEEWDLLNACKTLLEEETPIRKRPDLSLARELRGFAFLSAKPMLVLFNNGDDDEDVPESPADFSEMHMVIRGKLEQELSRMDDEEAQLFLEEFHISDTARDRVIRKSYELLGLISFFTVGEDEVRAWTIRRETPADDAAGTIHTDMKKGFIRAEVISYDDLMTAGSYAEARKLGTVRLEGKTYEVKDGDILNIRFNV